MNLTLDQHRLCVDKDGIVVLGEDGLTVFDTLSKDFVVVPHAQANEAIAFLSQVEAVTVMPESTVPQDITVSISEEAADEIWVKNSGQPTSLDLRARDDLISIVGQERYQKLLKDKHSAKKNVWKEIGDLMVKKGYNFGTRMPGVVCSQKWRNMESRTLSVIANGGPKNSGGAAVKKPDYYDDVHAIIKDSAKAMPKNLLDSLDEPVMPATPVTPLAAAKKRPRSEDDDLLSDEEEQALRDNVSSPFLKVQSTCKTPKTPKVKNSEILNFLKEDASRKEKQNEEFLAFLKEKDRREEEKKSALLQVLQALVESVKPPQGGSPSS